MRLTAARDAGFGVYLLAGPALEAQGLDLLNKWPLSEDDTDDAAAASGPSDRLNPPLRTGATHLRTSAGGRLRLVRGIRHPALPHNPLSTKRRQPAFSWMFVQSSEE
jgi:hypothetical protein